MLEVKENIQQPFKNYFLAGISLKFPVTQLYVSVNGPLKKYTRSELINF